MMANIEDEVTYETEDSEVIDSEDEQDAMDESEGETGKFKLVYLPI